MLGRHESKPNIQVWVLYRAMILQVSTAFIAHSFEVGMVEACFGVPKTSCGAMPERLWNDVATLSCMVLTTTCIIFKDPQWSWYAVGVKSSHLKCYSSVTGVSQTDGSSSLSYGLQSFLEHVWLYSCVGLAPSSAFSPVALWPHIFKC